ncbi:MAG TPA: TonB family protein [Longimicrobium sp.]|nr:TonB family protein [Longimicrobium sp.]
MFSVYDNGPGRRRRHWSTKTIAVSILAHGAAIGAIALSARQADARPVAEEVIAEWNLEEKPTPPPPPPPKVELPPEPKEPPKVELAREPEPVVHRAPPPAPVKGDFVSPRPPENPPVGIPAPDMNARPITQVDVSGIGKEGDVVGTVDASDTRAPTGNTQPSEAKEAPPAPAAEPEPVSDEPVSESEVDVRPSLRNADDVQRQLQRVYPPMLRDAGVTGETTLQFVIDENGRVEPGSVEILSSSDEQFAAAARRVVSSMRFSPAKIRGKTVRVTTSLPVSWVLANG